MQIEFIDKTAKGTKEIVAIRPLKHVMMNINKSHAQITVFTLKKLRFNTNVKSSVVIIKHGVESLPAEASVS